MCEGVCVKEGAGRDKSQGGRQEGEQGESVRQGERERERNGRGGGK